MMNNTITYMYQCIHHFNVTILYRNHETNLKKKSTQKMTSILESINLYITSKYSQFRFISEIIYFVFIKNPVIYSILSTFFMISQNDIVSIKEWTLIISVRVIILIRVIISVRVIILVRVTSNTL